MYANVHCIIIHHTIVKQPKCPSTGETDRQIVVYPRMAGGIHFLSFCWGRARVSTHVKLYTLSMYSLLCGNYTSITLFKALKMLSRLVVTGGRAQGKVKRKLFRVMKMFYFLIMVMVTLQLPIAKLKCVDFTGYKL